MQPPNLLHALLFALPAARVPAAEVHASTMPLARTALAALAARTEADPVVATFEGEDLHLDEFAVWLLRQRGRASLGNYINLRALEYESRRTGIEVTEAEVEAALEAEIDERVRGAYAGDRSLWLQELERSRTTELAHRTRRREELLASMQLEQLVQGEREFSREQLLDFFERRYGPDGRSLWLRTIRLPLVAPAQVARSMQERQRRNAELREGLVEELQGLRARAMAGEDFAELARAHSKDPSGRHGGKLGEPFRGDRWPASFVAAIRELEGDDISQPIYGRGTYGIYQIMREERTRLDEVAEELEVELRSLPVTGGESATILAELRDKLELEWLADPLTPGLSPDQPMLRIAGAEEVTVREVARWLVRKEGAPYLQNYLQERALRARAAAAGIVVSPEQAGRRAEEQLEQIVTVNFRGRREVFLQDLERRGTSYEQALAEREVGAEVDLLADALVRAGRTIGEPQLRAAWEQQYGPGGLTLGVRVLRKDIRLPEEALLLPPEEKQAALRAEEQRIRAELADLHQRIQDGEDFATLARAGSDDETTRASGGLIAGRFPIERWPIPVRDAIAALEPGQTTSPLVQASTGFLLQLVDRRRVPLESVQASLAEELREAPVTVPERATLLGQLLAATTWELRPAGLLGEASPR